jgi:putative ATPase
MGYEAAIREGVLKKREIQAAVIMGDAHGDTHGDTHGDAHGDTRSETPGKGQGAGGKGGGLSDDGPAGGGEILSWQAASKGREGWFKRLESGRSAALLADRDALLGCCALARHHRVLVAAANDGLLLWECLRRTPEGLTAALVDTEAAREALLRFAEALDQTERPLIACCPPGELPAPSQAEAWFSAGLFEHILVREPWRRGFGNAETPAAAFQRYAGEALRLLVPGGDLALLQSPPRLGERLSRVLREECGAEAPLVAALAAGEEAFFSAPGGKAGPSPRERWGWTGEALEEGFVRAGFQTEIRVLEQEEDRLLTGRDIETWFDPEHSSWGVFFFQALGAEDFYRLRDMLEKRARQGPVRWKWRSLLLHGRRPR